MSLSFENVKNNLQNHTILGRMTKGDNLFQAIKNDFNEDTVLGQMLQGKSYAEAQKSSRSGGLKYKIDSEKMMQSIKSGINAVTYGSIFSNLSSENKTQNDSIQRCVDSGVLGGIFGMLSATVPNENEIQEFE